MEGRTKPAEDHGRIRILITNVFNFFNKGEVMQLEALVRGLRTASFSILSIYSYIDLKICEELGVKLVGGLRPKPLPLLSLWALLTLLRATLWRIIGLRILLNDELREILHSDVIVDLGGDTFTDDPSPMYMIAHIYSLLLASIIGKPYIVCSQTIGPFRNRVTRLLARSILRYALAITAREPLTYSYLMEELKLENLYLAPDIAFLSPIAISPQGHHTDGFTVGLNISPLISNYMFPDVRNLEERRWLFIKLLSEVMSHILKRYGCRLRLIPHVTGPSRGIGGELRDDRVVLRMIYDELGGGDVELLFSGDPSEIGEAISTCDIFIGSRMHSAIRAMGMGIPTIMLAYSGKALGTMRLLDLSDYVIDIRCMRGEELREILISKLMDLIENYEEVYETFRAISRKVGRYAKLHLRVLEGWRLLYLLKLREGRCMGCGTCAAACPQNAISMTLTRSGVFRPRIDFERCVGCGMCIRVCPLN